MANVPLTIACGPYDRMEGIRSGELRGIRKDGLIARALGALGQSIPDAR